MDFIHTDLPQDHPQRAREILENWAEYAPKFIKVMPVDYRQALEKMQQSRSQSEAHH